MNDVNYKELLLTASSLLDENDNEISILANASALLNQYLTNINWVGFYLNRNQSLVLGPFQGKVACTNIPFSKGVCGACATKLETIIVADVHQFPGHIACDSASNSEIVLPIIFNDKLYGELDIDSFLYENFDENDKINLEEFVKILEMKLEKSINKQM